MHLKNEEHETTNPKNKKLLNIESAIIIALAIGAFNLSGYAHLEKYYLTLGIPIDRLNLATQKFSIYGGAGLTSAFLALLTAILIVSTFTLTLLILEKPEKARQTKHQDKPEWIQRISIRSQELSLAPIKAAKWLNPTTCFI